MDRPRVLIVWAIVAAAPAGAFARGADPAISCVVCPAGGAYAPPAGQTTQEIAGSAPRANAPAGAAATIAHTINTRGRSTMRLPP